MSKKSIIMIGPLPPPIGGVSIHISRLVTSLDNTFDVYTIDTAKNRLLVMLKLVKLLFKSRIRSNQFVVHNHVFNINFCIIIILLSKLFNVSFVQTIHSFRLDKQQLSGTRKRLIKFIIRNSNKIIAVNNKIKYSLIEFDEGASRKILVIPAFIPYESKITDIDERKYLDNLQIHSFITSHQILLCANAYKIVFYNNEDLYGIDLCVELMKKINQLGKYSVGLIFMLPQVGDLEYYNAMKKLIDEYGLEQDFMFINKEVDLVPLFKHIDIFIRPTNTDGDALSIREALYSGVPTISSDIVERPLGTILFNNRDISDLYEKVVGVLNNLEEEKVSAKEFATMQNDYKEEYITLYNEL